MAASRIGRRSLVGGMRLVLCFVVAGLLLSRVNAGDTLVPVVEGSLLSLKHALAAIWVRGEYCGSPRMCEGILYSGATVRQHTGKVVVIDKLLLLSPETVNCADWEPYWATQVVSEAFSPMRTGSILGHRYKRIDVGKLIAYELDLGAATDKSVGFAADGRAYTGEIVFTIEFEAPVPEDLHLQSFCDDVVHGTVMISQKRVAFRGRLRLRERRPNL